MNGPGRRPRDGARREVRELIGDAAAVVFEQELTADQDSASQHTESAVDQERSPLARVRAARFVCATAAAAMRQYALDARAAGWSWDDVAGALELADPPDGPRRGEIAYEWLVERRALQAELTRLCDRPAALWRCAACGARVRDTGPFESHPQDREQGHTEGCARHAAELAAWGRDVDGLDQDDGHDGEESNENGEEFGGGEG